MNTALPDQENTNLEEGRRILFEVRIPFVLRSLIDYQDFKGRDGLLAQLVQ